MVNNSLTRPQTRTCSCRHGRARTDVIDVPKIPTRHRTVPGIGQDAMSTKLPKAWLFPWNFGPLNTEKIGRFGKSKLCSNMSAVSLYTYNSKKIIYIYIHIISGISTCNFSKSNFCGFQKIFNSEISWKSPCRKEILVTPHYHLQFFWHITMG